MNPENQESRDKEKPAVFYHASTNKDIQEVEPRRRSYRDSNEGPVVFAAPDKALASIFLLPARYSGKFNGIPYAVITDPREDFLNKDKGGRIYTLPGDTFGNDPAKGLGTEEWTSKERIKPTESVEYESALDAALEQGVQVYFVDEATNQAIKESNDHGLSILEGIKSENQRRNINIKPLRIVETEN